MTFSNSVNGSNNDFELSTGTLQFANRTRLHGGNSENIGIAFSGSTLTVQGGDGNALSSTNPGYVNLQSLATPGKQLKFKVTANQTFTQAGLGNSLFGLTTAVNETNDIPFFLYAVSNANNGENAISFMISRVPHRTISPVAGNIGQSGNTLASTQGSFYSLATITAADYASSPCYCIGSFRMRYSSSLWSVQTINNSDGIGQYQEGILFTVPKGHFGAASGKWFADNGGTAPDQTSGSFGYSYAIYKNGLCVGDMVFGSVNVVGVGAVAAQLVIPFVSANGGPSANGIAIISGSFYAISGNLAGSTSMVATIYNTGSGNGVMNNAAFSNTSNVIIQVVFQVAIT